MSKEGSLDAPIRHSIDFEHPDFLNPEKLDAEMRRAFDICHGCRRCFNLCDSFPKLFDMIDESENEDVESLKSEQFEPVVDACTLCDMCFMTKCPYVPPHDFDLDFPHLMLRYRTAQKKLGKLPSVPTQLAQIDRNAKIGVMFSKLVNWVSDIKNKFLRKILEIVAGIDKRVQLPKYNSETFSNFFKKNKDKINFETPNKDRKVVIYTTCFVNFNKKNKDKINFETPNKDRKVVIYTTCFVNFNKKNTGVAALKVLKKNGVEVQEAYPGCCGMPFLEQADLPKVVEQAKKVSKDLLEWVDKGYKVITLTASCGLMLKFEWPLLLSKDENIKRLSSNVMDIDEYVVDIANNEGLAEGLQEIDGGVTVHNACHARAQNMGIKSRDMLKFIPNVKLDVVERCAGHGGTFGVMKETHDLANKVGRPTARQIKNKNNKYMASDCPLAGKHLKQLEIDTNISNDEALHPIELMAKSYKL
jgi:glycerol-3-phosphate dehydrogenase subunit C